MSDSPDMRDDGRSPRVRNMVLVGVVTQVVLVGMGLWYLTAQAGTGTGTNRLLVTEVLIPEELVFRDTEVGVKVGTRTEPVDVDVAVRRTPDALTAGEQLFREHCVSCHGESGKGDGTAGRTLDPPPRDLTKLTGWKRGTSLADLFRSVSLGLEGTQMAAFDYLGANERFKVTHYAMTFAGGHEPTTRAMLDSLDSQFSLAEGAKEPNTIPLSMAVDNLIGEATPAPDAIESESIAALGADDPRGDELFQRAIDPSGAAAARYWLTADSSWTDGPNRLRQLATAGAPGNGFAASSELLSGGDWRLLHGYLMKRYRPQTGAPTAPGAQR